MRWAQAMAAIVLTGVPVGALAADYPLPKTDFEADMRLANSAEPGVQRYHNGMLRLDLNINGMASVVLLDLRRRQVTVLLTPGDERLAMDFDTASLPQPLPSRLPDAKPTGKSRVGGEACTLYDFINPVTSRPALACISADGITLSLVVDGRKTMTATKIRRSPQEPSLFTVPRGTRHIPVPDLSGFLALFAHRP